MPAVGIHLDRYSIAAVRLDGSAKNPVIAQFAAEPMPPQQPGAETDPYSWAAIALDDFLKRHRFPRENAFLAIDSGHAIIRQFSVPFITEDQIRKTIQFQAEAHVHSVSIDDLELTWRKVSEHKQSSDVLINCIRKDALRQSIRTLKQHGIEPFGIDTPLGATANAVLQVAPTEGNANAASAANAAGGGNGAADTILWVDIGVSHTTMLLTQPVDGTHKLRTVRVPKIGVNLPQDADVITRASTLVKGQTGKLPSLPTGAAPREVVYQGGNDGPFDLPRIIGDDDKPLSDDQLSEQFASIKATTATPGGKTEFGLARGEGKTMVLTKQTVIEQPELLVRRIVTELSRTIISLGPELQPARMRISGAGEAAGMLGDALRAAFPHMTVDVLPAGLGIRCKPELQQTLELRSQALTVPVGMALKGIGANHLGFEFRRGEFSLEDSFDVLKVPVTACVFLLMLLFGALCLFVMKNQQRIATLASETQKQMEKQYHDAYHGGSADKLAGYKPPPAYPTTYEMYERMHKDFMSAVGSVTADKSMPQPNSAIAVWEALQDAIDTVGREPNKQTLNPNQSYNGVKVSEYVSREFPRRTNLDLPNDNDRALLELEWTITGVSIQEKSLVITGRAISRTGLESLKVALDKSPMFSDARIGAFAVPTDEDEIRRGQVVDKRSVYRINAEIKLPPLPKARPTSTSSSSN
ncbi:MAG: hypothetical protein AB7K09_22445 [Planctomycetota bacterium]